MAAENRTEIARELLTQLTEDLRLTQAAIAAATGVSQGALGDLLRGRRGAGPVPQWVGYDKKRPSTPLTYRIHHRL